MVQAAFSREAEAFRGVLPVIPLGDSPLFPSLRSTGVFGASQAMAEQLNTQGFAVIDLGRQRMVQAVQTIRAARELLLGLLAWRQPLNLVRARHWR